MPVSQLFSGIGDPNGVVDGNPGDVYQDQTGKFWVNTAAPSTWQQVSTSDLWASGAGVGSVVQNNGTGNLAAGNQAIAAGNGSSASGDQSVAIGNHATASGAQSVAIGDGPTSAGSNSVAIGDGSSTTAVATDAVAMGNGSIARGPSCVAMGDGCAAGTDGTTFGAVAIGEGAEADATGGCALNEGFATGQYALATNNARADGKFSSAAGDHSVAIREAQSAHASGRFAVDGDAQSSFLEMRGSTPGAAPAETVELMFGDAADQTLQLEDNKAYTIIVDAVVSGETEVGLRMQSFVQRYAVRRVAGVSTIAGVGSNDQFGDSDATSTQWTLTASIGAAPDRFVLTVATGATTAAVRGVAKVKLVEVLNA